MASKYAIFMLMNATRDWLSLSPEERRTHIVEDLAPIAKKYPQVHLEFYDAEAYTVRCSDIAVFRTEALNDYSKFIDDLRKSVMFTKPYYEVVDILPTLEADYLAGL